MKLKREKGVLNKHFIWLTLAFIFVVSFSLMFNSVLEKNSDNNSLIEFIHKILN